MRGKLFSGEFFLVFLLIVIGMLLSFFQTIVDIQATPAGTVFPLVHNYAEDYYTYLHFMRQGWEGRWTATSWMTPEQFSPRLVNIWFLFMGHFARLTNFSLPVVYTLGRVFGGILLYIVAYFLIRLVYPASLPRRITALLLVIFGGFWWGWQEGQPTVPILTHIWTELDPLVRGSYIPHHLWAKGFMVGAFLIMLRKISPISLIGLIVVIVFMGFSSPVTLATFLPTVFLWFLMGKKKKFSLLVAFAVAFIITIYHRSLETGIFPWNSYKPWEDAVRFPVTIVTYAQSLGPNLILFFIALIFARQIRFLPFLVSWTLSGFIMAILLGRLIPLSNIRFLEGYQWIPIAIVAAQGLIFLSHKKTILLTFFLMVFIAYALVGFWASMREHYAYLVNDLHDYRVYVPVGKMQALAYLDANTPTESVVLAPYHWGVLIPAFTGDRVVAGHKLFTYEFSKKMEDIDRFYRTTSQKKMEDILEQYRVSYIVGDPVTQGLELLVSSNKIEPMWTKNGVVIYKVR